MKQATAVKYSAHKKTQSLKGLAFFLCTANMIMGCATYQNKVEKARQHLSAHENEQAISILNPLAKAEGIDQLVYLFDLATALQTSGQYKESNSYFAAADKMSDEKNYVSLSKQATSLLLSEEFVQYKGEDYERLLVNVFSAINYLMLNDRENALVEVRRLNEKLEYYRIEEKKQYEQNTAALYISAMLWEADRNFDSAYIDYERAYKRDPSVDYLKKDLVRLAKKARRDDQLQKWTAKFAIKADPAWSDKNFGEVILIYQQGWGPRKAERGRVVTSVGFISPGLPTLVPVSSQTQRARVELYDTSGADPKAEGRAPLSQENTSFVFSIQDTSMKTLEDAYAPLIAKRIAAFVAKEVAAKQVSKDNGALGAILSLAMHATDRADLRQWSTLPQTIQVARMYIKPGKYKMYVNGLTAQGGESGEDMIPQEIEVKPGQKTFLNWRSFR